MAEHGGRRSGAGRKPRAERFARPIASAEKKIADRLPKLLDSLFELAEGITVREKTADGGEKIYDRPPCFKSASYLVDRILGKPTQAVEAELSGPGGAPLVIREVTIEMPAVDDDEEATADPTEEPLED